MVNIKFCPYSLCFYVILFYLFCSSRGWYNYWRDWRALDHAARRFRETKARGRLAARAEHIPLLSLDEVEFEDIMQEICQVNNIEKILELSSSKNNCDLSIEKTKLLVLAASEPASEKNYFLMSPCNDLDKLL